MAFRVPDSVPVSELRDEVISLPCCHTDQKIFDIAIAASYNGKATWLSSTAAADQTSPLVWQKMRGGLLAGFSTENTADAWPEGEIRTSHADLRHKAAVFRWRVACVHHWWQTYHAAQDRVEAYASWILFLRSADRHAWTWMPDDDTADILCEDIVGLKRAQLKFNRSGLKREMENRLERLDYKFLDHDIVDGVGPWGTTLGST